MTPTRYVACLATVFSAAVGAFAQAPAQVCPVQPNLLLAEYQPWHGLHMEAFQTCWLPAGKAYDSSDRAVIARHIDKAKSMGIDGFVVDWYGPPAGVANDVGRDFMDRVLDKLFDVAATKDFKVAVLYDEGTLQQARIDPEQYMTRAAADLQYVVTKYFSRRAYLRLVGKPALFVFPYPQVDPRLRWNDLRTLLGAVTLLDQDPNPEDTTRHDSYFDGFFAWVQADWHCNGTQWGEGYLHWFYDTMAKGSYASKLMVGGVWPGFDDRLAPWGLERYISRQNGGVWESTCNLAAKQQAPVVMIATWNDFEEGTDIEFGIDMVVDMEDPLPEVLIRSLPFRVTWHSWGDLFLQVYTDCQPHPIIETWHSPGQVLASDLLLPGRAYEIKVWPADLPLVKAVKTRRFDPPHCK